MVDFTQTFREYYSNILKRDPSEQELASWNEWAQRNASGNDSVDMIKFAATFTNAARTELYSKSITDDTIKGKYQTELGREATPQEITDWRTALNTGKVTDFGTQFKSGAQGEIKGILTGTARSMIAGDMPGYDEAAQKASIESQYGTAAEDLARSLRERAAGGGFETGGYYASVAKGEADLKSAKIGTIADLNNMLTQYKANLRTQGLGLLSGIEERDYTRTQASEEQARYDAAIKEYQAALRKQQENWWQAPLGALAGGVAGSWLGPGGFWAGATAGASAANAGTQTYQAAPPIAPIKQPANFSSGYYGGTGYGNLSPDYSYLWRKK